MAADELIVGWHAVGAAISHEPERLTGVWVDSQRRDRRARQLLDQAEQAGVAVRTINRAELDRMTDGARHQGIVARQTVHTQRNWQEDDLTDLIATRPDPLLLVLDGVQDPHNLGACLRSADAAGVTAVIVPADRAVGMTATVRKVASGAAETIPFVPVTNLARTLRKLQDQGVWLIGAAGEADRTLYQADLRGPVALVLGAEGKGLRRLTREVCDLLTRIPMQGSVESLNVAVATGIYLFEAVRQRS